MVAATPPEISLDELSERALAGDTRAESALFETLRVRFLAIAKRRVQRDSLEDVVQDALGIVHEKYGGRSDGPGILIWSLTVLRNVIGNYYQAKERRARREKPDMDLEVLPAPDSFAPTARIEKWGELTGQSEMTERVVAAIARLGESHPQCEKIFRSILASLAEGGRPREISQRALEAIRLDNPGMTRGNFYVILHRCRARLRGILAKMEESQP